MSTDMPDNKLAEALRVIRQHVAKDPSAVAASIIATCDAALAAHAAEAAQPSDGWQQAFTCPREQTVVLADNDGHVWTGHYDKRGAFWGPWHPTKWHALNSEYAVAAQPLPQMTGAEHAEIQAKYGEYADMTFLAPDLKQALAICDRDLPDATWDDDSLPKHTAWGTVRFHLLKLARDAAAPQAQAAEPVTTPEWITDTVHGIQDCLENGDDAYAYLQSRVTARPAQDAEAMARRFHETYERLAPQFGYETRADTREFDPESPNGKLMIAVCAAMAREAGQ